MRVQRMQERARRLVEEDEARSRAARPRPPRPPQPEPPAPPMSGGRTAESLAASRPPERHRPQPPEPKPQKAGDTDGLLSLFGGDQEQLLLLMLALLLAKNGAQVELVVALLYLAM